MFYETYSQPTVAALQEAARRNAEKAGRKGKKYDPVIVKSTKRGSVCSTWWGQAWCRNLERYSDYSNRLPRGIRYVRAGTVIDLQISKGLVKAKVQGSRSKPYTVTIQIDPLKEERKKDLENLCARRISSLSDLISGQFPKELQDLFTAEGGLFPRNSEIHFDCSCPDWASMCKHVSAVMYGIGVRLDENPFYFFELRGMDPDALIRKTVENKVEAMLENAEKPGRRLIPENERFALFGLETEE